MLRVAIESDFAVGRFQDRTEFDDVCVFDVPGCHLANFVSKWFSVLSSPCDDNDVATKYWSCNLTKRFFVRLRFALIAVPDIGGGVVAMLDAVKAIEQSAMMRKQSARPFG